MSTKRLSWLATERLYRPGLPDLDARRFGDLPAPQHTQASLTPRRPRAPSASSASRHIFLRGARAHGPAWPLQHGHDAGLLKYATSIDLFACGSPYPTASPGAVGLSCGSFQTHTRERASCSFFTLGDARVEVCSSSRARVGTHSRIKREPHLRCVSVPVRPVRHPFTNHTETPPCELWTQPLAVPCMAHSAACSSLHRCLTTLPFQICFQRLQQQQQRLCHHSGRRSSILRFGISSS